MTDQDTVTLGEIPEMPSDGTEGFLVPTSGDVGHVPVTAVADGAYPIECRSMEMVVRRSNMMQAVARVERKKKAPGVDGMLCTEIRAHIENNLHDIAGKLLACRYRPQALLRVEEEKPSGGTRLLGIPIVTDRVVQRALLHVIAPLFTPHFSRHAFGNTKGRGTGAKAAVLHAQAFVKSGFKWVVDIDIEQCFDSIDHDRLMLRVAGKVEDKRILKAVGAILRAPVKDEGVCRPTSKGVNQGGPISSLLCSIYLNVLDQELEKRGLAFVRYSDNCNIYVESEREGQQILDSISYFLWKRLKLTVNQEKSGVGRPWVRKYLGFTTTSERDTRLKVSVQSIRHFEDKLRCLEPEMKRRRDPRHYLEALSAQLRGWQSYYVLGADVGMFVELKDEVRVELLEDLHTMEHHSTYLNDWPSEAGDGQCATSRAVVGDDESNYLTALPYVLPTRSLDTLSPTQIHALRLQLLLHSSSSCFSTPPHGGK